jgi:hypothetical protein
MALPTPKELKKLADACRKAGIFSFKCGDLEFTLGDKPQSKVGKSHSKVNTGSEVKSVIDEAFEEDGLTQDALLMWSALPADGTGEESAQ